MNNSIVDNQIKNQIEGKTSIKIHFTDAAPFFISLYNQDNFYITGFFVSKIIKKEMFIELTNMLRREIKLDTDLDIEYRELYSDMTYDAFFEKYYNNL